MSTKTRPEYDAPVTEMRTLPRRRRRKAADGEREILAAAERFLKRRPFRELTVDGVMRGTGLARSSFYEYFRDRHHLVLRLVEEIGRELFAMTDRWLKGEGDPVDNARAALEGIADVYIEHGVVLRAIADAASGDSGVEAAYRSLVERFIEATAEQLARDQELGRSAGLDARRTAEALIWMNERYLGDALGRRPFEDREVVVGTLLNIWSRVLYERRP